MKHFLILSLFLASFSSLKAQQNPPFKNHLVVGYSYSSDHNIHLGLSRTRYWIKIPQISKFRAPMVIQHWKNSCFINLNYNINRKIPGVRLSSVFGRKFVMGYEFSSYYSNDNSKIRAYLGGGLRSGFNYKSVYALYSFYIIKNNNWKGNLSNHGVSLYLII